MKGIARNIAMALVGLGVTLAPSVVLAQAYPAKTITLVVPFPPGGTTDVLARSIGQKLCESWGQSVIVDNRPGAGATIGAAQVAKAPADGYTLLMGAVHHTIATSIYSKLPYDFQKDLAPVTIVGRRGVGRRRGLVEVGEIAELALPFLSRSLDRHLEAHGPGPEDLRRVYFILGGYSPFLPPPGYRLLLLGSEEGEPMHPMPVGNLVVMPRNLGMEMRLFKALAGQAPLDELLRMSREFLEKMAQTKDEVGPPYYFATITPFGYKEVSMED